MGDSGPAVVRDVAEVIPFGDAAVLITIGDVADPAVTARARAIAAALDDARAAQPALGRAVVGHASVLVPFDPLLLDRRVAMAVATEAAAAPATARGTRQEADERRHEASPIEIAVRYGGIDGPDLDEVAARHDLLPADVVELHATARYTVLFLGFAPGFGYLGGLPVSIATPRRASPRERVPAGSVAIAGEHAGVYPRSMPGGWNLIGRTDAILFDPARPEPALLRPGSTVRFVPAR